MPKKSRRHFQPWDPQKTPKSLAEDSLGSLQTASEACIAPNTFWRQETFIRRVTSTPDPDIFEEYRDTPPISIAILLQKYALPLAESSIYATNLYRDMPPICIAMLLQKYYCQGSLEHPQIQGYILETFRLLIFWARRARETLIREGLVAAGSHKLFDENGVFLVNLTSKSRHGRNCLFANTPRIHGGGEGEGSVNPRFTASLGSRRPKS